MHAIDRVPVEVFLEIAKAVEESCFEGDDDAPLRTMLALGAASRQLYQLIVPALFAAERLHVTPKNADRFLLAVRSSLLGDLGRFVLTLDLRHFGWNSNTTRLPSAEPEVDPNFSHHEKIWMILGACPSLRELSISEVSFHESPQLSPLARHRFPEPSWDHLTILDIAVTVFHTSIPSTVSMLFEGCPLTPALRRLHVRLCKSEPTPSLGTSSDSSTPQSFATSDSSTPPAAPDDSSPPAITAPDSTSPYTFPDFSSLQELSITHVSEMPPRTEYVATAGLVLDKITHARPVSLEMSLGDAEADLVMRSPLPPSIGTLVLHIKANWVDLAGILRRASRRSQYRRCFVNFETAPQGAWLPFILPPAIQQFHLNQQHHGDTQDWTQSCLFEDYTDFLRSCIVRERRYARLETPLRFLLSLLGGLPPDSALESLHLDSSHTNHRPMIEAGKVCEELKGICTAFSAFVDEDPVVRSRVEPVRQLLADVRNKAAERNVRVFFRRSSFLVLMMALS